MNEDIDYSEVFGLDAGAKEQEVKIAGASAEAPEPADAGAISAGDRSAAEAPPALRGGEDGGADSNEESTATEPGASGSAAERKEEGADVQLSPQGGSGTQRASSDAERDAEIARIKEDAQKTVDEAFAASGLSNPYTKKPITSKADFDEYLQMYAAEKRERILKKTGMSDDEFRQYVDTLPEVQQAKAAQAEAEAALRQVREQQAEQRVNEQLKEIGTLDPSIKTLSDLGKMPNYPEFYERVKRGMTLTEAFKLTNYDALTRGASAAGRQAALNAAGKGHLTPTAQRGNGNEGAPVPADVMAQYRFFNPEATDAEIRAHYNRNRKNNN